MFTFLPPLFHFSSYDYLNKIIFVYITLIVTRLLCVLSSSWHNGCESVVWSILFLGSWNGRLLERSRPGTERTNLTRGASAVVASGHFLSPCPLAGRASALVSSGL